MNFMSVCADSADAAERALFIFTAELYLLCRTFNCFNQYARLWGIKVGKMKPVNTSHCLCRRHTEASPGTWCSESLLPVSDCKSIGALDEVEIIGCAVSLKCQLSNQRRRETVLTFTQVCNDSVQEFKDIRQDFLTLNMCLINVDERVLNARWLSRYLFYSVKYKTESKSFSEATMLERICLENEITF